MRSQCCASGSAHILRAADSYAPAPFFKLQVTEPRSSKARCMTPLGRRELPFNQPSIAVAARAISSDSSALFGQGKSQVQAIYKHSILHRECLLYDELFDIMRRAHIAEA